VRIATDVQYKRIGVENITENLHHKYWLVKNLEGKGHRLFAYRGWRKFHQISNTCLPGQFL